MLQSYGTDPTLASWQGFVQDPGVGPLVVDSAYGSVLTRTGVGIFVLDCLPVFMDDQDTIVQVSMYGDVTGFYIIISFDPEGLCHLGFHTDLAFADPPALFNILVLDATDGVSNIEGPGGNP